MTTLDYPEDVTPLDPATCDEKRTTRRSGAGLRSRVAPLIAATLLCAFSSMAFADLRISGSDTLELYFQDALNQFERGDGAGIPVTASYKGSQVGLTDLCTHQALIAPSSAKMDAKSASLCAEQGVTPVELPIAFDAIVVIANPHLASMGELSLSELKTIFSAESAGKIVRWSQVRASMPDSPLS